MTVTFLTAAQTSFILMTFSIGMAVSSVANGADGVRSVDDGVLTVEQADRGAAIYAAHCTDCHGANMLGGPGAPGVSGLEFRFLWNGKTVAALYEAARTKMPPGQAGILSDQAYIDVIAAILRGNGFPMGEEELPADINRLNDIVLIWSDE
jgi:mono/diheme cytochrome c family protein